MWQSQQLPSASTWLVERVRGDGATVKGRSLWRIRSGIKSWPKITSPHLF